MIANEQPNLVRGRRGAPPSRSWNPPAELLTTVLAGLRGNPLVSPCRPRHAARHGPARRAATTRWSGSSTGSALVAATGHRAPVPDGAEQQLDALRRLVGRDRRAACATASKALLVSLSSAWQGAAGRRRAEARARDRSTPSVDAIVAGVHVPDEPHAHAHRADRRDPGVVPERHRPGRPGPRVARQRQALLPDRAATQVLTLPPRNTTARFTVEARASGTFPLLLTVTLDRRAGHVPGVADHRALDRREQRRASSSPIGAGLFLAVWWLTHARRRRTRSGLPAQSRPRRPH